MTFTKEILKKIEFADATLALFKSGNARLLIEKEGRRWLDELMLDAKDPDAPISLKNKAAAIREYLGRNDGYDSFLARFERYLMENTAPSATFAQIFTDFKQWLITIYQALDGAGTPITDDIHDWYKRILLLNDPSRVIVVPERNQVSLAVPKTTLLHLSEKVGCGATLRLESGEPCVISVAQSGVLVRKSRFGFFGAILYREKDVHKAATTAMELQAMFPETYVPVQISNLVLASFVNAAWHCPNAAKVCMVLNEAARAARYV